MTDLTATAILRTQKLSPTSVNRQHGGYVATFPGYQYDYIRRWYNRTRGKDIGLVVTSFGLDLARNVTVLRFKVLEAEV